MIQFDNVLAEEDAPIKTTWAERATYAALLVAWPTTVYLVFVNVLLRL